MRADVLHAGCGGMVTTFALGIWCRQCLTCIADSQELKPRGGWKPPAEKPRHVYPMDTEELLGNAGALA